MASEIERNLDAQLETTLTWIDEMPEAMLRRQAWAMTGEWSKMPTEELRESFKAHFRTANTLAKSMARDKRYS